ncbi:TKL protein kinase [Aphanomyces invadans]|uniref:TKL protein kinase n=1 Tax=Aphanomyces invadans TaxID=157072 RepID=A0A024TKB9_9STRA|nr:TKL protein kinase [Aphanomyces invadans]ETV94066.1 TKL protein kinase [Aphanomyces invadans]|eukprot:XP_008877269.1 TKL protein kinase [Aphanomyces invadans]
MASNQTLPLETTPHPPSPALTRPELADANAALPLGLAAAVVVLGIVAYFLHHRRSKKQHDRQTMLLEQQAAPQHLERASPSSALYHPPPGRGTAAAMYSKLVDMAAKSPKGTKGLANASTNAAKTKASSPARQLSGDGWKSHPALTGLWLPSGTEHMTTTPVRGCSNAMTGTLGDGTKIMLKSVPLESSLVPAFVEAIGEARHLTAHDSINAIFGVVLYRGTLSAAAKYMAKGSLGPLLVDKAKPLPPFVRKSIALQVASGLAHIHRSSRPFGALHSGNVLVESLSRSEVVVKLNGFALLHWQVPSTDTNNTAAASVETFGNFATSYVAPELLGDPKRHTLSTDVYALGILLGEIFTKTHPHAALFHAKGFVGGDLHLLELARSTRPLPFPYDAAVLAHETSSPAFVDVIERCVHPDPTRRPTVDEIVAQIQALDIQDGGQAAALN